MIFLTKSHDSSELRAKGQQAPREGSTGITQPAPVASCCLQQAVQMLALAVAEQCILAHQC